MSTDNTPPLFRGGLDPRLEGHFAPLCAMLGRHGVMELRDEVNDYVKEIHKALQHNEFLDVDTAERIAAILNNLLTDYDGFSDSHQKLIIGAARYFVHPHDADPDTSSLLGLDDDVAVLNYVLEIIRKPELKIEL